MGKCIARATGRKGIESAVQRSANRCSGIRVAVASALSGALLAGCSTLPGLFATPTGPDQAAAVHKQTIAPAEAAVLAAPADPALRAQLGTSYLSAGRFLSAAASLRDAVTLGDGSAATALRLALALIGSGREAEAAALLADRAEQLPAADLGLALALSGEVGPAIRAMESVLRFGENSVALRQNLALGYALAGRWREARLLAALDLPAGEVGKRMEQWAALAFTQSAPQRLAIVLKLPVNAPDSGLPVELALAPVVPTTVARARAESPPALAAAADESAAPLGEPPIAEQTAKLVLTPASAAPMAAPSATISVPPAAPQLAEQETAPPSPSVAPHPAASATPKPTMSAYLRRRMRSGGARW